jgi:hypothetical protein
MFDQVLVAVVRTLNGVMLGAEAAGITVNPNGTIRVDKQMRTSVPHILRASREGTLNNGLCPASLHFPNTISLSYLLILLSLTPASGVANNCFASIFFCATGRISTTSGSTMMARISISLKSSI